MNSEQEGVRMSNSPEIPDSSVVKECLTPDIVERLRSANSMPPYYGPPKLQLDAADEITRLTAEVAEYEATFDAAWKADMRGVQMWREAHPGNDTVLPDRANFTSWILTEIMRLRSLTVVQESLIRKAEAESEKLAEALETAGRLFAASRDENARLTAENYLLAHDRDGYVQLLTDQTTRLTAEVEQNAIDLEEYRRDVERLRAALLVARKYVLVQSCELSLMPEDAARDLGAIDEALEESDD
jgi:hypothetical protein